MRFFIRGRNIIGCYSCKKMCIVFLYSRSYGDCDLTKRVKHNDKKHL